MPLWTEFVDLVYTILFALSGTFGGNMGLAIAFLSLTFRLAVLPLTLRLKYRSLEVQAALKKLQPELSRIRSRFGNDPRRVWDETAKLHRRHGIRVLGGWGFVGMLAQIPLFLALFAAIRRGLSSTARFLWIRDLMKADLPLVCLCAIVTGLSAFLESGPQNHRVLSFLLPALLTLAFLWRLAAGIGIYTLASGLIGLLQSLLVRRHLAKLAA